jgi:hypothetical protein
MPAAPAAAPAGKRDADPADGDAAEPASAPVAPPARAVEGFVTLVCPPGAADAPISHGDRAFEPYREFGRSGRWLVDVPREAARYFSVGGFKIFDPEAPP